MKLSSESLSRQSYVCPSSNVSYIGDCPVTTCPLNTSIKLKGQGGCFLNNKRPDTIQAAYALGIHTGQAERRYEKAIQSALVLRDILSILVKHPEKKHCSSCYIDGEDCTHKYGCKERTKSIKAIAREPILKNKYLEVSKNQMWKIYKERKDIFPLKITNIADRALSLPTKGVLK